MSEISKSEKIAGLACYVVAIVCFAVLYGAYELHIWPDSLAENVFTIFLVAGVFFARWGWNLRHDTPVVPDKLDIWLK